MTDSNTPPPPGGPSDSTSGDRIVYVEAPKRSGLWWKILLGLVLFAVVLMAGCSVLIALLADGVQERIEEQGDLYAEAATITSCGVDASTGWGEVVVEFTNPLDEEKGFIGVQVNFFDANDVVVGSADVIFENIGAGQKARGDAAAIDLVEGAEVARCEVVDVNVL